MGPTFSIRYSRDVWLLFYIPINLVTPFLIGVISAFIDITYGFITFLGGTLVRNNSWSYFRVC